MSPGELAQLALSAVLSQSTKDEVALVFIAVDQSGNVNITTNVRDREDIPRILVAALETNADPDWSGDRPLPVKA